MSPVGDAARPPQALHVRDPGLQPERTALAWNRTGLSFVANALLALRAGNVNERWWVTGLGIMLLFGAAASLGLGLMRRAQLGRGTGPAAPPTWMLGATVLAAFVACVTAIAAIVHDA